ncbi:hypothetical protein OHJ21_19305 [Virgibacillus sp. LDC1]|nr:hypothetical protein [Virgibacillus sp. LDC1]
MNREEVLTIEPGEKMDELISEKVMGWIPYKDFSPSTDISAAWEAIEKVQGLKGLHGKKVRLLVKIIVIRGFYEVAVIDYLNNDKCLGETIADNAPEAISKALVLAVLEEGETK